MSEDLTMTQEQYELMWAIVTGAIQQINDLILEHEDQDLIDSFAEVLRGFAENMDDLVLKTGGSPNA